MTRRQFIKTGLSFLATGAIAPGSLMANTSSSSNLIRTIGDAEDRYGLPQHLGLAVSLVESGVSFIDGYRRPHPWAANIKGKSVFYQSKDEAIEGIEPLLRRTRMIDVGVMQINLRWHYDQFQGLDDIFDPERNIDYGIQILRENRDRLDNWTTGHLLLPATTRPGRLSGETIFVKS